MDFLSQGWTLSLSTAIDFTASNGETHLPQSLHYLDPTGQRHNDYESGIIQVGSILDHYSDDKIYMSCGFGGKLRDGVSQVSHCFPLDSEGTFKSEGGANGLLESYRHSLQTYGLYGPTFFAPVL